MTNLPQEGTSPDGMFGKPISEYSDEHALEDGVLVDLTQFTKLRFHRLPINRMTRHLFEAFGPELDNEEERKRFGYYLRWVFRVKFGFAQPSPEGVGDIWWLPPNIWLVLNDVGGWTAMYPEDY